MHGIGGKVLGNLSPKLHSDPGFPNREHENVEGSPTNDAGPGLSEREGRQTRFRDPFTPFHKETRRLRRFLGQTENR